MTLCLKQVLCEDGSIMVIEEEMEDKAENSNPKDKLSTNNFSCKQSQEVFDVVNGIFENYLIPNNSNIDQTPAHSANKSSNNETLNDQPCKVGTLHAHGNELPVAAIQDPVSNTVNFLFENYTLLEKSEINIKEYPNLGSGNLSKKGKKCSGSDTDRVQSDQETKTIEKDTSNYLSDYIKPGPPVKMKKTEFGTVDLDDIRFKCPECDKRLYRSDYFRLHFDLHLSKSYICPHCAETFLTSILLKEHIQSFHKIYECDYCPRRFDTKSQLHIHQKRKCVKCYECDIELPTPTLLKEHLETHGKETTTAWQIPYL